MIAQNDFLYPAGRPVPFPPTELVERHQQLAAHFVENILGIDPRYAFISDLSSLEDFNLTVDDVADLIFDLYYVDIAHTAGPFLVDIFAKIVKAGGFN